MKQKKIALAALVAAVVALVGSGAVAATRGDGDGWMMSRYGAGMMGYGPTGDGEPVKTIAAAKAQAAQFAERLDLSVGEAMQFSNHFYVELEENGRPATEVLVDPETGAVFLEYGPAMMWNERFGMMGDYRFRDGDRDDGGMMGGGGGMMGDDDYDDGMMSGGGMMGGGGMMSAGMMGGATMGGDPTFAPEAEDGTVTAAEARAIAGRWLAEQADGLAAAAAEAFPGYYTLHVARNGKIAGMLSVHASSGAVWYHGWHGRFVAMAE